MCGLSYLGDVRMGLAEDKNKVQRIVAGSAPGLHALYRSHLEQARGGPCGGMHCLQCVPGSVGGWPACASPWAPGAGVRPAGSLRAVNVGLHVAAMGWSTAPGKCADL